MNAACPPPQMYGLWRILVPAQIAFCTGSGAYDGAYAMPRMTLAVKPGTIGWVGVLVPGGGAPTPAPPEFGSTGAAAEAPPEAEATGAAASASTAIAGSIRR